MQAPRIRSWLTVGRSLAFMLLGLIVARATEAQSVFGQWDKVSFTPPRNDLDVVEVQGPTDTPASTCSTGMVGSWIEPQLRACREK